MQRLSRFECKTRPAWAVLLVLTSLFVAWTFTLAADDAKPAKVPKSEAKAEKKPAKKKLTGSELYAIHCNRCHPERYATERTATQWKTLMVHMRVRANLPAEEAKAILKYLQEDSGSK